MKLSNQKLTRFWGQKTTPILVSENDTSFGVGPHYIKIPIQTWTDPETGVVFRPQNRGRFLTPESGPPLVRQSHLGVPACRIFLVF